MNFEKLLKGIAIVIDDEIDTENANIQNIVAQIDALHIPRLNYEALPDDEVIESFANISFLLLDWRLISNRAVDDAVENGVRLPHTLTNRSDNDNLAFIRKLKEVCYCPIFIFSNEGVDDIALSLENAGLYSRAEEIGPILIRSKSDLQGYVKLKKELNKWIKKNPSIYVLKEWENEYQRARRNLFTEFQSINPKWPKAMWMNFNADGVNESLELGQLISRNLLTRMSPFEFDPKIVNKPGREIPGLAIAKVLEGERYLKKDQIRNTDIAPGDIFKQNGKYYINIRAGCDCLPDRSKTDETHDDVLLYLIEGDKLSDNKKSRCFNKKYGHFHERDNHAIVFPVDDGKAIIFYFKKLQIGKWGDFKNNLLGRLLPPHIIRFQQRYALYLQREALPRIPAGAIA